MGVGSIFRSSEEFTTVCGRSSEALKRVDEGVEYSIMKDFLFVQSQLGCVPFERALFAALGSYTRATIEAVVYKLLHEREPMDALRDQLGEVEKKIKSRPIMVDGEIPKVGPKAPAHEILPHLFLGNIEAAKRGMVPSGKGEGKPYGLMVKVTPDPVACRLDTELLDISVDDTIDTWDILLGKASGEGFSKDMPVTKWFKMTFNSIAVSLLAERDVLIFCSCGVSRSATVTIAFLMRLFGARFLQAGHYVQDIRSIASPNEGFFKGLRVYDALLAYSTQMVFPPEKRSGPMDKLREKIKDDRKEMSRYLSHELAVFKGTTDPRIILVGEIVPQLFLGDIRAAKSGRIHNGKHAGEPYSLMVQVTRDKLSLETDAKVLDISVSNSPTSWDELLVKTGGKDYSEKTPIEEWFHETFDAMADALLKEQNVLLFCSDGKSYSPIVAMAFIMRLLKMGLYKARDHVQHFIKSEMEPNCSLMFGMQDYEVLINRLSKKSVS